MSIYIASPHRPAGALCSCDEEGTKGFSLIHVYENANMCLCPLGKQRSVERKEVDVFMRIGKYLYCLSTRIS